MSILATLFLALSNLLSNAVADNKRAKMEKWYIEHNGVVVSSTAYQMRGEARLAREANEGPR